MIAFDYRLYRRPLVRPLRTHHGPWAVREGIVVRLDTGDRQGYGEVAPVPWFGSETLAQAHALCQSLPATVTLTDIQAIPTAYPACRFGLASAWEDLHSTPPPLEVTLAPHNTAYLLPTGKAALEAWESPWTKGYRTFKWKIGTASVSQELEVFAALVAALPTGAALRLDANGGLTVAAAHIWLKQCDRIQQHSPQITIDCLEQPLPTDQFSDMLALQQRYSTPIGLDESVATVAQLEDCLQRGWRGVVVIKAAIAGAPSQLRRVCQQYQADVIWSSVFETPVARQYVFRHLVPLISPEKHRAFGYGTQHWFDDGWDVLSAHQLWSRL